MALLAWFYFIYVVCGAEGGIQSILFFLDLQSLTSTQLSSWAGLHHLTELAVPGLLWPSDRSPGPGEVEVWEAEVGQPPLHPLLFSGSCSTGLGCSTWLGCSTGLGCSTRLGCSILSPFPHPHLPPAPQPPSHSHGSLCLPTAAYVCVHACICVSVYACMCVCVCMCVCLIYANTTTVELVLCPHMPSVMCVSFITLTASGLPLVAHIPTSLLQKSHMGKGTQVGS